MLPFWLMHKPRSRDFFSVKFIISGLCLGLHFMLWTLSVRYTTVTSATVAVCTSPIFIALIEQWLLKRRLRPGAVSGLTLALAGTLILLWNDLYTQSHGVLGIALSLIAALLYAVYILIGENVRQTHRLLIYVVPLYCFSAAVSASWAIFQGDSVFNLLHAGAREWLILLGLAIFPTILGHTAFNYLVRTMSAYSLSVAGLAQPFFSAILAFTLLHEPTNVWCWIGGALAIAGIYRVMRGQRRP